MRACPLSRSGKITVYCIHPISWCRKWAWRSRRGSCFSPLGRRYAHTISRCRAFDVIDAHYFYPDGVAAALLARRLKLPLVITGRGSDLTLIPDYPLARAQIRWAAKEATALVTVCEALKRRLMSLGVSEDRVFVMRNGVDLDLFRPKPRDDLRAKLGLKNFTLLSVGSLIPRKAHHLVIEALTELSDCTLVIVGEGPTRNSLEHLVHRLGLSRRVIFRGEVPHDGLADLYGAADALVLASESEGWANVLLESMACGTPVIASDVGGSCEVVRAPAAGILIASRTPAAIASAVRTLRANPVPRQATRAYAEQYGWRGVAEANRALLFALAARTPIAPDARNFLVDRKTAPML